MQFGLPSPPRPPSLGVPEPHTLAPPPPHVSPLGHPKLLPASPPQSMITPQLTAMPQLKPSSVHVFWVQPVVESPPPSPPRRFGPSSPEVASLPEESPPLPPSVKTLVGDEPPQDTAVMPLVHPMSAMHNHLPTFVPTFAPTLRTGIVSSSSIP